MTVRQLLAGMDSRELTEWMAYYTLEPFGEERADLRSGIVASTVANVFSNEKYTPRDFMPKLEPEHEDDPEESSVRMLKTVEMLNAAFGGKDLRHGNPG